MLGSVSETLKLLSSPQLYHADEFAARELAKMACKGAENPDDLNILVDTGWFQAEATSVPSKEQLSALQSAIGGVSALSVPEYWSEVADPTVAERVLLDINSGEAAAVVASFMSTLQPPRYKRVRVRRVSVTWWGRTKLVVSHFLFGPLG